MLMTVEHSRSSQSTDGHSDPHGECTEDTTWRKQKQQPSWSRRRFLGSTIVGLGTLIAACRSLSESINASSSNLTIPLSVHPCTPTHTPTPQTYTEYLPWVERYSPLSAASEPILTPTPPKGTPTPTWTNTAVPPTPTPTITPFPPGPPSKLGVFITRNDPQLFTLLKTGGVAVVKTLELDANFARQIKETSPRTRLIGRINLPQLELRTLNATTTAKDFVNRLLPFADHPARRPYFDAWEGFNEPVAGNVDEIKRLTEFEVERTRLLSERGIRSVIGNFGTGQPPLGMWEHFLPAVKEAQAHDGWLGLHEYAAPTIYYLSTRDGQGRYPGIGPQDSGWLTLRYRQVYNQILKPANLDIPLVMTELGIDGLIIDRPGPINVHGWQHFQQYWAQNGFGIWGPGAYVEQLVWYDQAMQQDPYVVGGCIFALAASQGWQTYEISGSVVTVLQQYFKVHAPP